MALNVRVEVPYLKPLDSLLTHISLYGTAYTFSRKFFTGWVIVSLLWAIFSFSAVTIFPIIEGRHLLLSWARALFGVKSEGKVSYEFDHHRRQNRQQDEESEEGIAEKKEANDTTAPVSLLEKSDAEKVRGST